MARPMKPLYLCAAMLASVALVAGCASKTGGGNTSDSMPFTVLTADGAPSLDPALANSGNAFQFMEAVYDTLVGYDPTTKQVTPDLATKWLMAPNDMSVTFTLRKGVKFHDGSSLTAPGVITAIQRTISIGQGESSLLDGVKKMTAPNSLTLVIELKNPEPEFLYSLSRIWIASAKAIREHAGSDQGQSWFASHEAGSGPYALTSYQPEREYVLKKFDGYWKGWSGQHTSEFVWQVADASSEDLQMEKGTADLANGLTYEEAASLESGKEQVTVEHIGTIPFYYMFNLTKTPFNNIQVRHAISLAVDYSGINQDVFNGWAQTLHGPIPDWVPDSDTSIPASTYNLSEAKALLSQAGYHSSHPLSFTFTYLSALYWEGTIATVLQADLDKIGVKMTLQPVTFPSFIKLIASSNTRPAMAEVAAQLPVPSPGTLLSDTFTPEGAGGYQWFGYHNSQLDSIIAAAETEPSAAQRATDYLSAEKLLATNYVAVWAFDYPVVNGLLKDVHGLTMDPGLTTWDWYTLYVS